MPKSVAYLGPRGTFSEMAASYFFSHDFGPKPCRDFKESIEAVELGNVTFAVIPIENNIGGTVIQALDAMSASSLYTLAELEMPIEHCGLTNALSISMVRRVYGHPQALEQCRHWIESNPKFEMVPASSNAQGAIEASQDPEGLAIASFQAGKIYGFVSCIRNIQDVKNNTTRFWLIGHKDQLYRKALSEVSGKTSIEITLNNQAGALWKVLEPIAKNGVQMLHIESRPDRRGAWSYRFYIDMEGYATDYNVDQALRAIEGQVSSLRLLGSYPTFKLTSLR